MTLEGDLPEGTEVVFDFQITEDDILFVSVSKNAPQLKSLFAYRAVRKMQKHSSYWAKLFEKVILMTILIFKELNSPMASDN